MHREGISDTQALRRVHDWRTCVLVKDLPSKREGEKSSQDSLEDEGEVLPNLTSDPNATIIAVVICTRF
jgi:hypothetical protein